CPAREPAGPRALVWVSGGSPGKTAPVTSRSPRDSRLRLVPSRPMAAARTAATVRRNGPPRPPDGTPAPAELAAQARQIRDDAAVLRGWVALFDAWSLAHLGLLAPEAADPALVAEVIEAAPQLLSFLHLSCGPVPVPALLDLLRQRVAELRTERHEPPADG